MIFRKIIIAVLLIAIPSMIHAEELILRDGSVLVGTLVKVIGDTLYFKPSFSSPIKFAKIMVWRIQFNDSLQVEKTRLSERAVLPGMNAAEPGSLFVSFDNLSLSNKIVVHRDRDFAGHERANRIESILVIDGLPVASFIDSTTDKKIREGPDTILKNTIRLSDFRVQLESGPHTCTFIVRNPKEAAYEKAFEFSRLDLSLNIGDVIIYPGRKTTIEVGMKKGFLRMGETKLYVK